MNFFTSLVPAYFLLSNRSLPQPDDVSIHVSTRKTEHEKSVLNSVHVSVNQLQQTCQMSVFWFRHSNALGILGTPTDLCNKVMGRAAPTSRPTGPQDKNGNHYFTSTHSIRPYCWYRAGRPYTELLGLNKYVRSTYVCV